ncbi:MAG: hypothetical protein PHQ46_07905 [Negativicutes bacterium]|nr:hypothetical protein [Negativicutes bacterium]
MRHPYPISPIQCQAARTYLGWTQDALAKAAEIARTTVCNFEDGCSVRYDSVTKICTAFEIHGIEFTEGEGVKRRSLAGTIYHGYGASDIFYEDLLNTAQQGEELFCMAKSQDVLLQICGNDDGDYAARLAALGQKTKVRCLITEAQTLSFEIPSVQFRVTSARIIGTSSSFGYGNKFALALREGRTTFVFCVFNTTLSAQNYRMDFLSVWEDAAPMQTQAELRERLLKASGAY